MVGKRRYLLSILILVLLYVAGLCHANTRLTYLEFTNVNEKNDLYIELDSNGDELKQEFIMPYDIFQYISVQIGTFGKDNNSTWRFSLSDSTEKVLYEDTFDASRIEDGEYYRHRIKKKLSVKKGELYSFTISAVDVSDISKLAFYASSGNVAEGTRLTRNEEIVDNTLCFKVYGGDRDYWWHGLATLIFIAALAFVLRMYFDGKKHRSFRNDAVLHGMIVGAALFLLLCSFSTNGWYIDENDNMRGGMIIADGGVLYKDYITQHMPVMYYLCSVFALLGAGSIEQFRLSYFIFECIIWSFLYIRHKDCFGAKKMALLPLIETVCVSSMLSPEGYQVLADGFVGLMFTALMLEFLRYYKDRTLNWDRCCIISVAVWGSIGASFLSVYTFAAITPVFIGLEISYFIKNKATKKEIFNRYCRLFIATVVPFALTVMYFKANHALRPAFEQSFVFNRKVYPKYMGGLGYQMIQPFINGIQNLFDIIAGSFNSIVTASATNLVFLQFSLMAVAVCIIIKLIENKRVIEGISLGLMIMFSASRGYGFHGLAAWYMVILTAVLYADLLSEGFRAIRKPLLGLFAIILTSTFFITLGDNLISEQLGQSELESKVVELTEQDLDKGIFLDAWSFDSLYLYYKGRKPVNPAVYMLPWYMDWFEKTDINALLEKRPHVVVFDENREVWDMNHFTNAFDNELKTYYTRLGDDDWRSMIWIKNE